MASEQVRQYIDDCYACATERQVCASYWIGKPEMADCARGSRFADQVG